MSRCDPPLGRVLASLYRHVEKAVSDAGLSLPQYRALSFLSDETAASAASRLAERLAVSRPAITALVDGLVARGWVERRVAESDRRRVDHVLTPSGRSALHTADDAVNARLGDLAARLDDRERDGAIDGLAMWGQAIESARLARLVELAE